MLDPRRLRTEASAMKAALARRGVDASEIDKAVALDERWRHLTGRQEALRARVRSLSKEVGEARRAGDATTAAAKMTESRELGDEEKALGVEADGTAAELRDVLLRIPNMPDPAAPDGQTAEDNVIVRVEGYDPQRYGPHQRVPHWDVGAELGILDLPAGAKLSGSMFPLYRGAGAALVRALCQLALDRNADAFEEVRPPTLVRTETMVSTGHLPKFEDDAYHVERDDLWAIPTAEVPLTSLARDELLDEARLPWRLMAHTSCFRREAGSAGRDTRGLLRVHEFDKVEILAYATPEQAEDVHADLLARAEGSLAALGLAYRVLDLCAGDLGASSARTFDIEVYAPGCDLWLEASSVSWFTDYQARRANVRYRPATKGPSGPRSGQAQGPSGPRSGQAQGPSGPLSGQAQGPSRPLGGQAQGPSRPLGGQAKGTAFVHTLNGSGLAVPRVWAALVETYRQPDGSVAVPDVLQPYLRGLTRIER